MRSRQAFLPHRERVAAWHFGYVSYRLTGIVQYDIHPTRTVLHRSVRAYEVPTTLLEQRCISLVRAFMECRQ